MKTNLKLLVLSSIAASLMLTGCGGGSGSSSTPTSHPVVNTCSNGATDYPTCTPAIVPADLQLTVPAPPFAEGSQSLIAFNYLNDLRMSLGLGKFAYSPEITKSTANHANYMVLNAATFADPVSFHNEISINPGFTGILPPDRAQFAGYASVNVTEVIAASNTMAGAVQRLIDTIYHRAALLNQQYTDIGSSVNCFPLHGDECHVINVGYKKAQRNASDFVMVYPKDGQTNITLSMGLEAPNPFPEITYEDAVTKIGYPVTFAVEAHQTLVVTKFTISEAGQTIPMPAWILTSANDPNNHVQGNEAYLTAKGALKPNTTYNVAFEGTANGKNVSKNWNFATADRQLPSF